MAGGGGRVVPGLLLDEAEVVQGVGLAEQVTEVTEQGQGPVLAGNRGRVVPGLLLQAAQDFESLSLAVQVAEVAIQRQGPLLAERRRLGSPRSAAAPRPGR